MQCTRKKDHTHGERETMNEREEKFQLICALCVKYTDNRIGLRSLFDHVDAVYEKFLESYPKERNHDE